MKTTTVSLTLAICVTALASLTAPLTNYGIFVPEWEVEVSPGGPLVNLSGTIEEVHTELLKLNPDWDTHYLAEKETRGIADTTSSIQKRSFDLSSYFCGGRWPACLWAEIRHGVSYLRGVQGRPVNGAGPGNCGRVSCSYDSAIWWCNDNHQSKTLGSFGDIADGAQVLQDHCAYYPGGTQSGTLVSGQAFAKDNWNVIVRRDSC